MDNETVPTIFNMDECIMCQIRDRGLNEIVLEIDKMDNYLWCEACANVPNVDSDELH